MKYFKLFFGIKTKSKKRRKKTWIFRKYFDIKTNLPVTYLQISLNAM